VTPVVNQGQCGSSGSFAAAAAVEGAEAIFCNNSALQALSVQQLIDCAGAGCNGDVLSKDLQYIQDHGLLPNAKYPRTGTAGTCKVTNSTNTLACPVVAWKAVPPGDNMALKAAVARQPVLVAVDAASQGFQFYSKGIFCGSCGSDPNQALLIVGYGSAATRDYWILKNSWGSLWGERGYINLLRSDATGPGECGVASSAFYPVLVPALQEVTRSACPTGDTYCIGLTGNPASFCKFWDPRPNCEYEPLNCSCTCNEGDAFCRREVGDESYCDFWAPSPANVCHGSTKTCSCSWQGPTEGKP